MWYFVFLCTFSLAGATEFFNSKVPPTQVIQVLSRHCRNNAHTCPLSIQETVHFFENIIGVMVHHGVDFNENRYHEIGRILGHLDAGKNADDVIEFDRVYGGAVADLLSRFSEFLATVPDVEKLNFSRNVLRPPPYHLSASRTGDSVDEIRWGKTQRRAALSVCYIFRPSVTGADVQFLDSNSQTRKKKSIFENIDDLISPDFDPTPSSSSPPSKLECPYCQKVYLTFFGLRRHVQFHEEGKLEQQCPHCNKVYKSPGALKMHLKTHSLPCVCESCGKSFSRPWLLKGHRRTHTGEKPFVCESCGRSFADRSNLRAHQQTHSGEKRYRCVHCNQAFARMQVRMRHEAACSHFSNSSSSEKSERRSCE
ncbi:unnamed protein product [Caenorhabditis auriculariae]|uniref:C2H2-type domain-containing protein n=1 Tax=Caenorhabditis auriculariae TaxID=2777116 RepID=A0A8S1HFL6_9PELO|nr:unnamed protein product [Caenorhabditis auriculariae]